MTTKMTKLAFGMLLICVACAAPSQKPDVDELRAGAERGDANAALGLALLYDSGTGVPKSQSEAARWYGVAAGKGEAEAQNSLGSMYQAGEGVPQDYAQAMRWYSAAAEQGHAEGLNNLAYLYDLGLGVPEDNRRAAGLYERAAEKGSIKAMLNLGLMLARGEKDVERDTVRAFMWLDLARFYTQFSQDMRLKWRPRGALDELKKQMTPQDIAHGEEMSRKWASEHRTK